MAVYYKLIQQMDLFYVVDVDIKGFFDNISHGKLLRQMWAIGIRDKTELIIRRSEPLNCEPIRS